MIIPKYCEVCDHPLVFFPEYGKSFCPVCEKGQLARFSLWVQEQHAPKAQKKKEEQEHLMEEEIKHQAHINKAALKAVLLKHIEESRQRLEERQEFFEGKIEACQEILRLVVADSTILDNK